MNRKVLFSYSIKIEGVAGEIFPYRSKEGAQAVKPSKGTIGFPSESVEDALLREENKIVNTSTDSCNT